MEPGEQIVLEGGGFVVGPATLTLEGFVSAPGQAVPRRPMRLALDALATSSTRATSRLGRRHFDQFRSQHTTFTGRAVLRFPSKAGPDAPAVTASLDSVRLDLFASPTAHEASARRARDEGRRLLARIGVAAAVLPEGRGLAVERVAAGSLAERAGVQRGDAIVTAESLTVATVADLAPPPRSRALVLGVRRPGASIRRISFPLDRDESAPDTDRIAAMAIAGCALLLILATAGPLRGPFRALGLCLVGSEAAGPRRLLSRLAGTGARGPGTTIVALLLYAAAPFAVMALCWTSVVVVAGIVCLVSIGAAASEATGWSRLWAALVGALRTIPLAMTAAIAAVRAASMDLDQIVAAQGSMPWHWTILNDPASLALALIVVAVTASGEAARPGPASAALRGMAGSLAACVLLGGWAASADLGLVGQIGFAVKGWALGLCFPASARSRWIVTLTLSAVLAAAAIGSMVLPLPPWVGIAAPWTAAAAGVFVALPLAIRWLVATSLSSPRGPAGVEEDEGQRDEVVDDPPPREATARA